MITIALSKGRIEKRFYQTLKEKNITSDNIVCSRNLKVRINNDYIAILVKSSDIINFILEGYADVGIIGSDVLEEENSEKINELLDLKTGKCKFALAALRNKKIDNINTIATKYPLTAKRLISEMNLDCKIVTMSGSLEVAPLIGYSDAIIDLVETGQTLEENGLEIIKTLEEISTRVISTYDKSDDAEIKKLVKKLR